MSGHELQPSFREKLEIAKKQHFPGVERSEVIDAIYDVPDLGPMDFYFTGAPVFIKTYVIMIVFGFILGFVGIVDMLFLRGDLFLTPDLFLKINVGAAICAFIVIVCVMWIFISMNKGTFNDYKRVINFRWFSLDRKPAKQGEFRVKRIVQIWPRESITKEADEQEKKMYEELLIPEKQLMALAGITPKLEEALKNKKFATIEAISTATVKKLKEVKGINDDFASVLIAQAKMILETRKTPEEQDKERDEELTEMEKASSLYRMRRMLKRVKGLRTIPTARDIAKEGISLRQEFIRLARSINSKKVFSILECAGNLFILVISDYPLTGGDDDGTATNKQVEFKDHDWVQRTYVWAAKNQHATWGDFVHLADYKYYQIPEAKARGVGKEAKVKHAPIAWLQNSDGRVERDIANIANTRLTPTASDIAQSEIIYDVSVTEKLLERDKLLTQTISRMKEEAKQIWRDATDWAKNTIAKAVEKILLEEKLREVHGKWNVKLLSKYVIRGFTYICVAIILYFAFAMAINALAGTTFPLPWDTGGGLPDPGGGNDVGGVQP